MPRQATAQADESADDLTVRQLRGAVDGKIEKPAGAMNSAFDTSQLKPKRAAVTPPPMCWASRSKPVFRCHQCAAAPTAPTPCFGTA